MPKINQSEIDDVACACLTMPSVASSMLKTARNYILVDAVLEIHVGCVARPAATPV